MRAKLAFNGLTYKVVLISEYMFFETGLLVHTKIRVKILRHKSVYCMVQPIYTVLQL